MERRRHPRLSAGVESPPARRAVRQRRAPGEARVPVALLDAAAGRRAHGTAGRGPARLPRTVDARGPGAFGWRLVVSSDRRRVADRAARRSEGADSAGRLPAGRLPVDALRRHRRRGARAGARRYRRLRTPRIPHGAGAGPGARRPAGPARRPRRPPGGRRLLRLRDPPRGAGRGVRADHDALPARDRLHERKPGARDPARRRRPDARLRAVRVRAGGPGTVLPVRPARGQPRGPGRRPPLDERLLRRQRGP